MKTEVGELRLKCFDIFPQVIVNNIFIKRLEEDKDWYLLDHTEILKKLNIDILIPGELEKHFDIIEQAVLSKKLTNIYIKKAKDIWKAMLKVYIETGDLYICHKENMNKTNPVYKNNMYIQSANLCVESYSPILSSTNYNTKIENNQVIETYDMGYYHTCNLVSLNLAEILNNEELLEKACRKSVRMLDKAIEITTTPINESKKHNDMFRTIGIGVVGMADWIAYNRLSYKKDEDTDKVEALIEKIAYYTLDESCNLAQEKGSFKEFDNSYFKDGIILGKTADELMKNSKANLDWKLLSEKVKKGVRNALITALPPNSSTSLISMATASYLPTFSKFNYETLAKANVPIVPRFLKNRFWYYEESWTIPTEYIIKYTNKLQKWVDTGMSMELIINPSITTIKNISDAIIEGFKDNLKTVYYSRTLEIKDDGNIVDGNKEVTCASCSN